MGGLTGSGGFSAAPMAPAPTFAYPYGTGKLGRTMTDYLLYGLGGQKGRGLLKQGRGYVTPEYLKPRPEYPFDLIAPRDPTVQAAIEGRTQKFMETPDINYFTPGAMWGGGPSSTSPGQFLQELFQTGMPITTANARRGAEADWERQLAEDLGQIKEGFGARGGAMSSGLADTMMRTARDARTQFESFWTGRELDEQTAALGRRLAAVDPLMALTQYQDSGQNLEKIATAYGLEDQSRQLQQQFLDVQRAEQNRRFPEFYGGQGGIPQTMQWIETAGPGQLTYPQQLEGMFNPTTLQALLPMLGGAMGMMGRPGGGMGSLGSLGSMMNLGGFMPGLGGGFAGAPFGAIQGAGGLGGAAGYGIGALGGLLAPLAGLI